MYLKDPNSKDPSPTTTIFVVGSGIACIKLLLSGITIGGFAMSQFTGVDFGAAVGALGAIYTLRTKKPKKENDGP